MSQPYLSLERAKEMVVEIVETSPRGTRNPIDEEVGSCLYEDGNGNRCIAGEVLHRMGMPKPSEGFRLNCLNHESYATAGYMSDETRLFLGDVQKVFDGCWDDWMDREGCPTWRQALADCRKQGLL